MADSPLRCVVVTPEETSVDVMADSVSLPLFDGELGVLKGHAPMIGRLGYGELCIKSGSETTRLFVDGGFVQISDDVVSIMTSRAVPLDELDPSKAEQELTEALGLKASGDEAITYRDKEVARARGMLRVASRA